MARRARVFIAGTPVYIRLNGSLELFKDSEDYEFMYETMLSLTKEIEIHSYILCSYFLEFLATPYTIDALPRFMQNLGRRYVGYYNKKYERSGTLWEDRYRSSIVEKEIYGLWVMRYIESRSQVYGSRNHNLRVSSDALVKEMDIYNVDDYRRLYEIRDSIKDSFVEEMITKQLPIATPIWIKNIEHMMGLALEVKERGRPKKEEKKRMYKNLVVLDKQKHSDLKIGSLNSMEFARGSTYIPIIANEIMKICDDFPVVFSSDGGVVALVSLGGDSLAVDMDGRWITSYIPAFLRRYPFSLATTQENPDQRIVLIDEDSGIFSRTSGNDMFVDGESSEALNHAVEYLYFYDQNSRVTNNILKDIQESQILDVREIAIGEGEEKKVLVDGFLVVDREKLNALDDKTLADWARRGIISFIEAHMRSLENIQKLFDLAQSRQR